ncbi:MAG TPA: hypothetical protein VJT49_25035 [Amycolatopsis sp.]|uniref:hypothetical protein n=1 Tax=Amycolatopsis sp. TaxID=37632 RepID=UPI002B45AAD5|nr:hypothetical protein [Amycolatopsis sp.]HKS48315.1 hypothetical protein [Amycolatopsis sp.]
MIAREGDRFWLIQQAAEYVRSAAGFGSERQEDGAPRYALTYRNWQKFSHLRDGDLVTTHKDLRLWRCVAEGCRPGLWYPQEVGALTAEEKSPAGKLRNVGAAVW